MKPGAPSLRSLVAQGWEIETCYTRPTMSFDLAVWYSDQPLSDNEAEKIYLNLCENWPFLEGSHTSVTEFYNELVQKWPEIDAIPEERVGDFEFCPWSCALCHSGTAIVTSCVWPMADKVSDFVMDLAYDHDLVCFDPQARRVILPAKLLPKKRNPTATDSTQRASLFARLLGLRKGR